MGTLSRYSTYRGNRFLDLGAINNIFALIDLFIKDICAFQILEIQVLTARPIEIHNLLLT